MRRRITAAAIAVALAVPMVSLAQPVHRQSLKPEVDAVTYADGSAFGRMVEESRRLRRIAPTASHDSSDNIFVFPLAGNTPGAFGTFFRSEATIVNQLNRSQRIEVFFFPAGAGTCSGVPVTTMTLAPFNFYVWRDFVSDVFGINGLGSLGIVAIDSQGNTDSTAAIDGTLRIYTNAAGGGSVSQNFDSAGLTDWGGNQSAFGLRQDSGFRTNFGIFNYLGNTRTFDVTFSGTSGLQTSAIVTVAPCSVSFQNVPTGSYNSVLIDVQPRDANGGWYGFASSNDNVTGDSWSISARP